MTEDARRNRVEGLTGWGADWAGLRVAVLGLGVSGFAAADTLAELGAHVLVVTETASAERAGMLAVIGVELCEHERADAPPERLIEFAPELVIVSPGFRPDHPQLQWARSAGIAVWGDIELAWRVRDKVTTAEWILVTGTNGKTTTVELTAGMLAAGGLRVAPCGNIGIPVLDAVRDPRGFDVYVVELSSFQLHWLGSRDSGRLRPLASACLNIADDHLDWHGSAEAYRAAKAKVYDNTVAACVYNRRDPVTEQLVRAADVVEGARAIGFGAAVPGPGDIGIVDGVVCDRAYGEDRRTSAYEVCTLDELAAAGLGAPHIVENVLAAIALARSTGIGVGAVREGIAGFRLDLHRIHEVAVREGVRWVDDSKATNPHAAAASLSAYDDIVWVVGGLLKGVDVGSLVAAHAGRLRAAVIIGVDRDALREAFARHAPAVPVVEIASAETEDVMAAAVSEAARFAQPGDTVLLAPAAASMDQFTDYADRGRRFAEAVERHGGGDEGGHDV